MGDVSGERAVGHDLLISVIGHGGSEDEAHAGAPPGLQLLSHLGNARRLLEVWVRVMRSGVGWVAVKVRGERSGGMDSIAERLRQFGRVGGRWGRIDGDFGVGCGLEGVGFRADGEQQLRCTQGAERDGRGEVLVEEEAGGKQAEARVVTDGVEEVGVGGFEDDGWDFGVCCREVGGEGGADADAVGDDVGGFLDGETWR